MGRHSGKKFKKTELNKVKFKIGRKLPKNLNETRATFKAKTLVLKQQFQLEKEGPVSHRNLTLKELLVHLNHHNQSIRCDAINSLREMLQKNAELFLNYELSHILECVCPLFIDREYKIRKQINDFVKLLLNILITSNKLQLLKPFYKLINAHLSCAMTHIDENIQYNSLILLDTFIQYLPNLIYLHSYSIFDNFIEQISKLTTQHGTNQQRRTLKNDPYKLTSTQSWRSNVLSRLYKIMLIVSNTQNNAVYADAAADVTISKETTIKSENDGVCVKFGDLYEGFLVNGDAINRESFKLSKRLVNAKNVNDVRAFFMEYVPVVAPLLIDCWIEAKPEDSNVIDSHESFDIMHSVLSILNLMLENLNMGFTEIVDFVKTSKKTSTYMENLFLLEFPFVLSEGYKIHGDRKAPTIQASITSINLLICKFCISSVLELSSEKLVSVLEYCLNLLDTSKKEQHQQQQLSNSELVIILKFSDVVLKNFTSTEVIKPYLSRLLEYFDKAPQFSTSKWLVFEFLTRQFYENQQLSQIYNKCMINFFNKTLKFCISHEKEKKHDKLESLFEIIRKCLLRKQPAILKTFHDEYINLLNALDFEDENLNDSCKKKLLELVDYIPKINNYLFTKLAIIVISKKISISCVNQILGILKLKLDMDQENDTESFTQSDYLMFLLTLFNGYTGFDLTLTIPDLYSDREEFILIDDSKMAQHFSLCKQLKEFLSSHSNSSQMADIIVDSSLQILVQLDCIPCSTIYGLLVLLSNVSLGNVSYGDMAVDFLQNVTKWCHKNQRQMSEEHMENLVEEIFVIYMNNLNYINQIAPNFKNHKIFEIFYSKFMQKFKTKPLV